MSFAMFVLILLSGVLVSGAQRSIRDSVLDVFSQQPVTEEGEAVVTDLDCTYLKNPNDFLIDPELRFADRTAITGKIATSVYAISAPETTLDANSIPRRTFIDNSIFDRMAAAGIQSAPLATDAEYLRRVMLDMTGRIPSATDLNNFLADPDPGKRDALVDRLLNSPEFVDKWSNFFGDLFKNNSQSTSAAINRNVQGRDAFYLYIKTSVAQNKPYDQMARELVTATGNNYVAGEPNWILGGNIGGGPVQDVYDGMAAHFASTFMGLGSVDCLLCHDGARHLDSVNLWGARQKRFNMWGLSAYFSRVQFARQATNLDYNVNELSTGDYRLNTTTGNRSARQPTNGVNLVAPKNPFVVTMGTNPGMSSPMSSETRREALIRQITPNIQFSRAIVNYIWEEMMVEAFVSPSNTFDMARLDPDNPPPAGWDLQPTNPRLLNELAVWFRNNGYNVRALISAIAKSNAYQLSATYPGTWKLDYVPYYARRYARRLGAEEIHDAIQTATGIVNTYTFAAPATLPAVQWAMQMPEPREPRNNGAVLTFMSAFGRGDRDLNPRREDGSLLQGLNMMNNAFVMGRIHQANAGSRVATILAQTSDPTTIVRQLFQNTLSRNPTAAENALFVQSFQGQTVRVATENLQWVLLNKLDFLFNY
jgi:hypothetical protein